MEGDGCGNADDETVSVRAVGDVVEMPRPASATSRAAAGDGIEKPPLSSSTTENENVRDMIQSKKSDSTRKGNHSSPEHLVVSAAAAAATPTPASAAAGDSASSTPDASSVAGSVKTATSASAPSTANARSVRIVPGSQPERTSTVGDETPVQLEVTTPRARSQITQGGGGQLSATALQQGSLASVQGVPLPSRKGTFTSTLADMHGCGNSPVHSLALPADQLAADAAQALTPDGRGAAATPGLAAAVQSENALLVAAGVYSDDEAESLVHFAVPKNAVHPSLSSYLGGEGPFANAAAAAAATSVSPQCTRWDGLAPNYGSVASARNSVHSEAGEGATAATASSASGPGSSVDLDFPQHDGPSPVRTRTQKQCLSPQGSLISRYSPRASIHSHHRRPLSLNESALNVYPFVEPRHPGQLLMNLEKLWNDKTLCDVVICVDGRRIPAHRAILSAGSAYFHAMFTGGMAESRKSEIEINELDGAAVAQLIAYAYTCKVDIHSQNVQNLLKASSILLMSDVMAACQLYMADQLHPSNCLGIRMFSQQFGCTDLYKSAEKFVEECFLDIIKQEEYLQLSISDVTELLSRDDVNVENECQVYEAVLRWIQYAGPDDTVDRRKYIAKLLGCVRLPFLPADYIADHVEKEEVIKSCPDCQPLLLEALKYHLLPERCILSENPRTQPRRSTVGSLFAVGGMDLSRGAMTIEEYNYRINAWHTVGEMRSRRLQCGVAVIGRYIYTVGGRDGLKTLNSVERFDTRNRTWSGVASMCTHRHGVGVAVLSGPMYAVGGHDGWSYLNTVERFVQLVMESVKNIYIKKRSATYSWYICRHCTMRPTMKTLSLCGVHINYSVLKVSTCASKRYMCYNV